MLGDALPELSASIQARLFAAFGLELIYNKHDRKVTICTTIAPSTPQALAEIIAGSAPRPRRIGPFFTTPQNNTRLTFMRAGSAGG